MSETKKKTVSELEAEMRSWQTRKKRQLAEARLREELERRGSASWSVRCSSYAQRSHACGSQRSRCSVLHRCREQRRCSSRVLPCMAQARRVRSDASQAVRQGAAGEVPPRTPSESPGVCALASHGTGL